MPRSHTMSSTRPDQRGRYTLAVLALDVACVGIVAGGVTLARRSDDYARRAASHARQEAEFRRGIAQSRDELERVRRGSCGNFTARARAVIAVFSRYAAYHAS